MSESDWSLIDQLTYNKANLIGENSKTRQLHKFARLYKTQKTASITKGTVINLSGQILDDGLISLLQKGLNYAITPHNVHIEEVITGVERAVHALPVESAEEGL